MVVVDLVDMQVVGRWVIVLPSCFPSRDAKSGELGFNSIHRSHPVQRVFTCGEDIEPNNVQVFHQLENHNHNHSFR